MNAQTPPPVSPTIPSVSAMGRRALSFIVDVMLWILLFVVAAQHFGTHSAGSGEVNFYLSGVPAFVFVLAVATYFVLMEWLAGGTLGKLGFGIRVTDEQGAKPTFLKSLLRNTLRIVDGFPYVIPNLVGFAIASNNERKQRLGDKMANTVVTKADKPVPAALAAWLVLAALVVASISVIVLVPASDANTAPAGKIGNAVPDTNSHQPGQNGTAESISREFVDDLYSDDPTAGYRLTAPAYQAATSQAKNSSAFHTASQLLSAKPTEDHRSPMFNQSPNQSCYIYDSPTKRGVWYLAVNLQYVNNNWLVYNWQLASTVQCPR